MFSMARSGATSLKPETLMVVRSRERQLWLKDSSLRGRYHFEGHVDLTVSETFPRRQTLIVRPIGITGNACGMSIDSETSLDQ